MPADLLQRDRRSDRRAAALRTCLRRRPPLRRRTASSRRRKRSRRCAPARGGNTQRLEPRVTLVLRTRRRAIHDTLPQQHGAEPLHESWCGPAPPHAGRDTARAVPESPAADGRCRRRYRAATHPPTGAHPTGRSWPHTPPSGLRLRRDRRSAARRHGGTSASAKCHVGVLASTATRASVDEHRVSKRRDPRVHVRGKRCSHNCDCRSRLTAHAWKNAWCKSTPM